MKNIRYILLDPTGNLTCLVLDAVDRAERSRVTAALMDRCEQVGYLMEAHIPGTAARLEMMGGEFCGNASMATAVYLAGKRETDLKTEVQIPLEVSSAEGIVQCTARKTQEGWIGSASMPLPRESRKIEIQGKHLIAICFPGMIHLIWQGERLENEKAEQLLLSAAEHIPEPALGLIQWDATAGRMTPLVYVRDSGTLVWETACGSGTAAVACMETARQGKSLRLSIAQPGGIIQAKTTWEDQKIQQIVLSGKVQIGQEEMLSL